MSSYRPYSKFLQTTWLGIRSPHVLLVGCPQTFDMLENLFENHYRVYHYVYATNIQGSKVHVKDTHNIFRWPQTFANLSWLRGGKLTPPATASSGTGGAENLESPLTGTIIVYWDNMGIMKIRWKLL